MGNSEKASQRRKLRRRRLLNKIPPDAYRVKVKTADGKSKFRDLDKLEDSDEILTKKNGDPIVMMNPPGRPEVVSKTGPTNEVNRKRMADREKALGEDPLILLTKERPESADVLSGVMVGLAEEAGSIAFERREAEKSGKDSSAHSVRRVRALKAVAETWLRRQEQLVASTVDMDSPPFQAVMGFVMETFRGAMADSFLDENTIKVVFARFSKKVGTEEWRHEARNRMKANV